MLCVIHNFPNARPKMDRFIPFRKSLCLAFAQDDDFFSGIR
jgi:hypothetical protein